MNMIQSIQGRWLMLPAFIFTIASLSSCSDDDDSDLFLNGKEKTPLVVSALMDKSIATHTRAVDQTFDQNDVLIAYLRHVTWDGTTSGERLSIEADYAPMLVSLTKGGNDMVTYDGSDITPIGTGVALGLTGTNTKQTFDLTPSPALFWDDFSNSSSADKDLRTDGHYLQSFYGYCYNGSPAYGENGSHITTALDEGAGTLSWKVETDQHEGFKSSDLLWSYEQTPVAYSHAEARDGLIIPYTHAMSKVTVEVVCEDGFHSDEENFANTSVVLKNMNTVASLTAPTGVIVSVPGDGSANVKDITTQPIADTENPNMKRSFAALITPTVMKDDQVLAEINDVDGNNYTLTLTDAILNTTETNDWESRLTGYSAADGGTTQPGVNYLITVKISKQAILVEAIIRDWDEVSATGVGEIQFSTDIKTLVTDPEVDGEVVKESKATFDLYKKAESSSSDYYGVKASTVTWDAENSVWTYTPPVYWQNKDDKEYFRALSGAKEDLSSTPYANESLEMENGRDVLWGTTAKHSGKDINDADYLYDEGEAIDPRSKNSYVPLIFRHAMSKITVNLYDGNASSTDPDAKLDLKNATIQLINLATSGTINLHTGEITAGTFTPDQKTFEEATNRPGYYAANNPSGGATTPLVKDYCITPQVIGNNARIIITLADGTRYSAQLNQCVVKDTSTFVNTWEKGKHYIYEITIGKEQIMFRALIKEWDIVETSGNATLEWD